MAIHLFIHGLVQGVGYRYYVKRIAERYGLKGYVRNLGLNTVEVWLEPDPDREILMEIRKGPLLARVERVEEKKEKDKGLRDFKILESVRWEK